jgi:site-specific DNA-methyltransferase (adenine-specific)
MSDVELALTSFDRNSKVFHLTSQTESGTERFHVCQKPVALYKWLLTNYAKQGDKILDTHLGSGSIAIACHYLGFDLTGCELDPDYFAAMQDRIKRETQQMTLL